MSKQLFDQVIGVPPGSTVDVDRIIKREKRVGLARRATGTLTGIVALGLLATGLVTVGGLDQQTVPSVAGPTTATSTGAEGGFRLVSGTSEEADATARRLSGALEKAFAKAAPGARWIYGPKYVGETPGPDGVPPRIAYRERPNHRDSAKRGVTIFRGGGNVLADGRKGSLLLEIRDEMNGQRTGPFAQTHTYPLESANSIAFMHHEVSIKLADGRVLTVTVGNGYGLDMAPPAQAGTPLTPEQVVAIATDVAARVIK